MNIVIKLILAFLTSALAHAAPEISWPADTPPLIQSMLVKAMKAYDDHPALPYKFGGNSPEEGGMDCSGAVTFILKQAGVTPPRTAAAQHEWLKKTTTFIVVPANARSMDDAIYEKLRPGDLIFWAADTPGVDSPASHVHMFLGKEKLDNLRVMIGASDGRSYRGKKVIGYGIVDFRVPKVGSKTRIIGFGPVPLP